MRSIPRVTAVVDQGVSADGQGPTGPWSSWPCPGPPTRAAADAVAGLRSTFATSGAPPGLEHAPHRPRGPAVDQQSQNGHTQTLTELLSVLFILALLFLTFRALLAPLSPCCPRRWPSRGRAGHRRLHPPRGAGLRPHPHPPGRGPARGGDRLRALPHLPGARGAPAGQADVARGGLVLAVQGGRVDHLLRPDRRRGPGHRGGGHLRPLPGARARRWPSGSPWPSWPT